MRGNADQDGSLKSLEYVVAGMSVVSSQSSGAPRRLGCMQAGRRSDRAGEGSLAVLGVAEDRPSVLDCTQPGCRVPGLEDNLPRPLGRVGEVQRPGPGILVGRPGPGMVRWAGPGTLVRRAGPGTVQWADLHTPAAQAQAGTPGTGRSGRAGRQKAAGGRPTVPLWWW